MAAITIYSTDTCPYCQIAKEYFKENNIVYTEKNVGDDVRAREEMIQKSGQMGVPVIDIDGNIVVGFDKKEIENLLSR